VEFDAIKEKIKTVRTLTEDKETAELCKIITLLINKLEEKEAGFKKP
jgi:hypothetical protein